MENENTNTNTTNVENTTDTYLAEIEKLKTTTVDKAAYDKLLAENRKLITTLAQSPARGEEEQAPAPKPDLLKLGRDFLNAKSDIEKTVYSKHDEQFPIFAWIALVVLIVEIFILDRKISWLKDINFFSKNEQNK